MSDTAKEDPDGETGEQNALIFKTIQGAPYRIASLLVKRIVLTLCNKATNARPLTCFGSASGKAQDARLLIECAYWEKRACCTHCIRDFSFSKR